MKKIITSLFALALVSVGFAQNYFQATMQNNGNRLTFSIKPIGGDINAKRFSAMEFFVRFPNSSPVFSFSTPVVNPAFTGMNFIVKGPNLYGAEAGYTNYVFEWIGGATFVPAVPTNYLNDVAYPVFTVDLVGTPNTTDIELVHNTDQNPTYINISDNTGNSLSCLDNFGVTLGAAFYGPGFNTAPAVPSGINHILPLAAVPIPVKFIGFTAIKKDNNGLLNWQVENESAITDVYQVERSLNGRDFTAISTQGRNNNGSATNVYQYTDFNIKGLRADVIYYRIKQLDKDGKFAYTDIKSIRMDGKSFSATIFPNPVVNTGNVNIDLVENMKVNIILTDAAGKEVHTASLEGKKGANIYKLNMDAISAGTYQLKIIAGSEQKVIPVVKSK